MKALLNFWENHNFWASWLVLAIGMVIILLWAGWRVGFDALQWVALIVTTVVVAGIAAWIISWEEDGD